MVIDLGGVLRVLGEDVRHVTGRVDRTVTHPAPIDRADDRGAITFCSRTGPEAADMIRLTGAGVVLCANDDAIASVAHDDRTLVMVTDPRLAFMRIVTAFFAEPRLRGIHPTAVIEGGSRIHDDVYIGPYATVSGAEIGEGSVIHAHVHIYPKTRIGRRVTVHAGTVIGADGFGYQRSADRTFEKFPHIGGVVIHDDVEIGANTCIDRGTLGDTIVREGAKIDNLVHIAHNVVVGRHAAVIAHVMVGGSTRIGDHAWVAPSACLRDGVLIGQGSMVGLAAVVTGEVPDHATVIGSPARPLDEHKRMMEALKRLAGTG